MRLSGVWRNRLLRYWAYFRRGHGVYLMFVITFLNFIVLQWSLLIEQVEPLRVLLGHLYVFAIVFFFTYVPVATLIGWIDFKRGSVPVDQAIGARASPWARDLAKALILLAEGKKEEVIELMEKWAKE